MAPRGIAEFYYTQELPSHAVTLARVKAAAFGPGDLVDVSNTSFQQGTLGIWKSGSNLAGPADFTAPDYNQPVSISGDTVYYVSNQFYQITNQVLNTIPLFFYHPLVAGTTGVTILDLDGNVQASPTALVSGQLLYHDMAGGPYYVRYVDGRGFLITQLLQYNLVLKESQFSTPSTFIRAGRTFQVSGSGTFYVRFTRPNGYQVAVPYNTLPNTPWFARISYGLTPVPPEWARQLFLPQRPYVLASWVPGKILSPSLIEFERKQIFLDIGHLPDILVFDKEGNVKYALDGTAPGSPRRRGTLYPWKRGHIKDGMDVYNARVEVTVILDPTDVVYGFYSYNEQDVVYSGLDINPFTNPVVKNRVIRFYFKSDGADPFHYIYHQVVDQDNNPIAGLTNDPSPGTGTATQFATLIVGGSVGAGRFTIEDTRSAGGGLLPQWEGLPDAVHFWDLGYWDGKPYPSGGGVIVHLPISILGELSAEDVQAKLEAILPMGVIPVVFYYDSSGEESRTQPQPPVAVIPGISFGTRFGAAFGS